MKFNAIPTNQNLFKPMKTYLLAMLILLLAVSVFPLSVSAVSEAAIFTVDKMEYSAVGKTLTMDAAPFIDSGRTLVPVRFLATALGVTENDIGWNAALQQVTLKKGSTTIVLKIGSTQLTVNGKGSTMDTSPLIRTGRTFLPARYVAEALGYTVGWDPGTRSVLVTGGTVQATTHAVEIKDFKYNPLTLTIRQGDTVTWTNQDTVKHTATGDAFDSGLLGKGESFSFVFAQSGTYPYICTPHPYMKATIIVE